MEGLKKFKKRLTGTLKVEHLILFGSQATGMPRSDSDIDLVLVSPQFAGMHSWKRRGLTRKHFDLNYPVDLLCYTPEEFDRKKSEASIIREAVENGIEI